MQGDVQGVEDIDALPGIPEHDQPGVGGDGGDPRNDALGQSGLGLSASFTSVEDGVETFGFNAAYSFQGMMDLGFQIGHTTFDALDASTTAFGPYVRAHFLRGNPNMPVSLFLGGGYNYVTYNDVADDPTAHNLYGEAGVYLPFEITNRFRLIPTGSFIYSYTRSTEDTLLGSINRSEDTYFFGLGADFAFGTPGLSTFYFTPNVFFGEDGDTQFALSVGFVLGQ